MDSGGTNNARTLKEVSAYVVFFARLAVKRESGR
jgi:hypothetical protein